MRKLVFKELFLFSSIEKKARKIEFSPSKTMITSSSTDGTDRGKSVIMKSLYHTMGADCFFEDKWDDASKTYILSFAIDDAGYYIFRHNKLFKVFDANKDLLFMAVSRHELAERLYELFHFAVKLPKRSNNEDDEPIERLEVTPPATITSCTLLIRISKADRNSLLFRGLVNILTLRKTFFITISEHSTIIITA